LVRRDGGGSRLRTSAFTVLCSLCQHNDVKLVLPTLQPRIAPLSSLQTAQFAAPEDPRTRQCGCGEYNEQECRLHGWRFSAALRRRPATDAEWASPAVQHRKPCASILEGRCSETIDHLEHPSAGLIIDKFAIHALVTCHIGYRPPTSTASVSWQSCPAKRDSRCTVCIL
jgi:hypothetical protein